MVACGPGTTIATPAQTKPVDESSGDAALARAGFGMVRVAAGLALILPNEPGDLLVIDTYGRLLAHHRVPLCN